MLAIIFNLNLIIKFPVGCLKKIQGKVLIIHIHIPLKISLKNTVSLHNSEGPTSLGTGSQTP